MDTLSFLRKILPPTGLYVVARLIEGRFKHQVCDSVEEMANYVIAFDSQGVVTYHACAAYREHFVESLGKDGAIKKQVRVHKNVRGMRALWMDLDVKPGDDKHHQSQEDALMALVSFCDSTGLPMPMVLSSGWGIHIYWPLTAEVGVDRWKQAAETLKVLAAALDFKSDPACTADQARILRPTGTWNRKVPTDPRPVELIQDADPIEFVALNRLIMRAAEAFKIKPVETVKLRESAGEQLNEAFSIKQDFPPCSGRKVAEKCAQLGVMRDAAGNIAEPLWYAGIQLLIHSLEGDELIHEWSRGYPGYTVDETNMKIEQLRSQAMGPTLCSTFEGRNPSGCDGCPFKGKISSPAQLGATVKAAAAPTIMVPNEATGIEEAVTLPNPPLPYTRGENGGIYAEEDGILHKIYPYDCFPIEVAWDEHLGFETLKLRHWLPQEKWKECVVQSSLLARPVDFEAKLRDNHIQPLIRNRMANYMDTYVRTLKENTKLRHLFNGMGWKENNTEFVLGGRLYRKDGAVAAGRSRGTTEFLDHFQPSGSLAVWRTLTSIFNTPGFEPHAFMLLMAFAAPLLRLDARSGFTVAALGPTGAGKSTMGKMIASVYGNPEKTWVAKDSTNNAQTEHIGAYQSIPAYTDEITTIKPKDLRELVYKIATGKGRESLRRDRTMRPSADWSTILIASTNESLQGKLQLENSNPEAESMRLFELHFPNNPEFVSVSGDIHSTLIDHYGTAGHEYIRQLVVHREEIKKRIRPAIELTEREFGMKAHERFWTQAVALALFGGGLAREWGIIDFDPAVIRVWAQKETRRMRGDLSDSMLSATSILGEYLNEHIAERLVVSKINNMEGIFKLPQRGLSQRYERDAKTLYISRSHIRRWLDEHHHNYTKLKDDLFAKNVLLSIDARKILGAGTDLTGEQIPCWKIRTDHPELVADAGEAL